MRMSSLLSFAAILFADAACAQALPPSVPHPHFVEQYEYFTSDAQYEDWYTLTTDLRSDFDNICGDTFCEGDYSNLQSLSFDCSVRTDQRAHRPLRVDFRRQLRGDRSGQRRDRGQRAHVDVPDAARAAHEDGPNCWPRWPSAIRCTNRCRGRRRRFTTA